MSSDLREVRPLATSIDPIPKYDEFMLPTLQVLRDLGGSASIEEIQDRLTAQMGLTQEQLDTSYPASGALIAPDRMSWARSRMKPPGFVESAGKGVWVLTDLGRQAADRTPAQVKQASVDAYKLLVAQRKAAGASVDQLAQTESPSETADWKDIVLDKVKSIEPSAFERLCQRLLRESGFVKVEVTGKSGDGGIDGSGVLRMNLISFQVLFQCKRYVGSVAAGVVRDFRGAMQGRADKGLIITTGSFTSDARKEATRDGAPAIDLIDGEALCLLLKDLTLGVRVRQVVTEEVVPELHFFDTV